MSIPILYSLDNMTMPEWFHMLSNDEPEKNPENPQTTYVYEIRAYDTFQVNEENPLPAGLYYLRGSAEEVNLFASESFEKTKLSFTQIIYLSDIFSVNIANMIPNAVSIKNLADEGEASRYFYKDIDFVTKGLETMREKVWTRYFDQGFVGLVRRFFSAIANFFLKYDEYMDTGIDWPGNSCAYTDQVVDLINKRLKKPFICKAYKASRNALCERLELSVEDLESMDQVVLKKEYHEKVKQFHPDKNKSLKAADQFKAINRVWGDFVELRKLKENFKVDLYGDDGEIDLSLFLTSHKFTRPLALMAPTGSPVGVN